MKLIKKQEILNQARKDVVNTRKDIHQNKIELQSSIKKAKASFKSNLRVDDRAIKQVILKNQEKRIGELDYLYKAPFFVRCDCKFDNEKEVKSFYFAKFNFSEKNIFSWVSKVSSIRFESPGKISYQLKSGEIRKGELIRKDQFMIVGGKILFMASESLEQARELIYQEHLTRKKDTFVLPEIVEQMEKAQDEVIRAHHRGPFLISGPAGSGKTTLALHRVAYLMQSPDTQEIFQKRKAIVLVQDSSSKEYFGNLLPELGVEDAEITTFFEWATNALQLDNYNCKNRIADTELEKDLLEFQKNKALENLKGVSYSKNIYSVLENVYKDFLDKDLMKIFKKQKEEKTLDKFDLTILLKLYLDKFEKLNEEVEIYQEMKNGTLKKKNIKRPLNYSLMVIDEVQNYLKDQINIFKSCSDKNLNAIIYVGDLAQQTHLCTLKEWSSVGEDFEKERAVILQKVYRNTKQIMEYIKKQGFEVDVPKELKSGKPVEEFNAKNDKDCLEFIKANIQDDILIGILAKAEIDLIFYKNIFKDNKNIKVMTINESQGVEFDTVFLLGIDDDFFKINNNLPELLKVEKEKVNKDLFYVALTRAMNRLFVIR